MPRMKFGRNEKEFRRWMRTMTHTRKYSLYVCLKASELVAVPLVSTDPVNFGIFKHDDIDLIKKLADELKAELVIPVFTLDSLEFSDEPKP